MIQQSPTERANPNSIYEIAKNSPRASYQDIAAVDERDVDAALGAYVPGGASALCWLPMKDGHTIEPVARDVMRSAIAAVDKRRSLASQAAQPAEADGWVMVPREPTKAMLDEACMVDIEVYPTNIPSGLTALNSREARSVWSAFLAATPKAPATNAGEEGPPCENCGAPVRVGHVVLLYDDVGELHADCANPYSLTVEPVADGPKPCVLVGSPMTHVPVSALAAPPAPNDDLRAALAAMLREFDADEFGSEGQMQVCAKARAALASTQPAPAFPRGEVERAIDEAVESTEWSMSNFLPARGETGGQCEARRLREAVIDAIAALLQGKQP